MGRVKQKPPLLAQHKTYDLEGWEGGIAVYCMDGEHGTKIIAIPRLGLSTCLTGYHSFSSIVDMLERNRLFRRNPEETERLANWVLRDFD